MNGKKSGCVSLYNPDGMVYAVCECDNGIDEENGDVVYKKHGKCDGVSGPFYNGCVLS